MDWQVPILADVLEARRRIAPYLSPTPLFPYPTLNEMLGADVFVKHENHQPLGALCKRASECCSPGHVARPERGERRDLGQVAAVWGILKRALRNPPLGRSCSIRSKIHFPSGE
jgi:hypothetical protein